MSSGSTRTSTGRLFLQVGPVEPRDSSRIQQSPRPEPPTLKLKLFLSRGCGAHCPGVAPCLASSSQASGYTISKPAFPSSQGALSSQALVEICRAPGSVCCHVSYCGTDLDAWATSEPGRPTGPPDFGCFVSGLRLLPLTLSDTRRRALGLLGL